MFNMYVDSKRHDSPNSSLYTGKRRRSLPKVSDGIASIMETNREKTIAAMTEGLGGGHSLLYFVYTCAQDLFIGGLFALEKIL